LKRLIREEEVREAAKNRKSLFIDDDTVLTPSAKDMAKELGVKLEDEKGTSDLSTNQQIQQKWPFHKVAIASDHGGFYMKEELKTLLRGKDFMVFDLGPANTRASDYPDFALKVAEMISEGKADCGIMIDSVGIGSAMAANKVPGILAAKCNNVTEAKSAREHNYANLLTMGSKIIGSTAASEIALAFLGTKGGAERHQKRVMKILNYEAKGNIK
jgi:ribose 5-phosphate isomerase B